MSKMNQKYNKSVQEDALMAAAPRPSSPLSRAAESGVGAAQERPTCGPTR